MVLIVSNEMRFILVTAILSLVVFLAACTKQPVNEYTINNVYYVDTVGVPPGAVKDVDGNIYPTVVIGTQRWMAENLKTSKYKNGDPIPYQPHNSQWAGLTTGAWCYYESLPGYGESFGKLYNWYTVVDPRGVCPTGWHVPSDVDWQMMESAMGMAPSELLGTGTRGVAANIGGHLKSLALWNSPNTGATDSIGFKGLPGGNRLNTDYYNMGVRSYWWSTTEYDALASWHRSLGHNTAGIYRGFSSRPTGLSIRCVQD